MILIDTSAWFEFDRGTGSATALRLRDLVGASPSEIAVTGPVMMEVLAGARDERRSEDLRRLMLSFHWLAVDAAADFEGAAKLYRACRRAGHTPRGLTDCLIATVAIRNDVPVLTHDRDFDGIAAASTLLLA